MIEDSDIFVSRPENVVAHPCGSITLKSGRRATKVPLWDKEEQLFARLTPQCGEILARLGMRRPTFDELKEIQAASVHIAPYTMPKQDRLAKAGILRSQHPAGKDGDAAYLARVQQFLGEHMRERGWCAEHDAAALHEAALAGWTEDDPRPVFNIGKHWDDEEWIYGWDLIQPHSPAHKGTPHTDYATLVFAVYLDAATGGTIAPDTLPSPVNSDEVLGFLHRLPAFDVLASSILGSLEEAFDDFLDWFSVDGMPVGREADPHPEAHDGPRCLVDKKTSTAAIDVFECLPDGDRRAKLILLAQWHLETAGGAAMHNYNIGNVKGRPGDAARCWQFFQCGEELTLAQFAALKDERVSVVRQYKRGNLDMVSVHIAPEHPGCCFRAFEQLRGGVLDYVALLKMPRYAQAYQRALAGDVAGFGLLLGQGGYYTAPVDGYTAELGRRLAIIDRTLPASH